MMLSAHKRFVVINKRTGRRRRRRRVVSVIQASIQTNRVIITSCTRQGDREIETGQQKRWRWRRIPSLLCYLCTTQHNARAFSYQWMNGHNYGPALFIVITTVHHTPEQGAFMLCTLAELTLTDWRTDDWGRCSGKSPSGTKACICTWRNFKTGIFPQLRSFINFIEEEEEEE